MKHPFNCMGLLALPALATLLFLPTGDPAFLGFLVFWSFSAISGSILTSYSSSHSARRPPPPLWRNVPCWAPCCCSSISCPRTAAPCPRRWD